MLSTALVEFLLQAGGEAPAGEGGPPPDARPGPSFDGTMFIPLILIIFIFWFLIFRPESKRRKEREAKVRALKKGDQVVTAGGILGKVTKVEDAYVMVQVDKDKDVRVRFGKSSILDVLQGEAGKTEAEAGSS